MFSLPPIIKINGAVERIRTFKQAMKVGEKDGLSPQHRLENFLLSYRTTPHTTTGTTPCSLFIGRSIRTRLDPDIAQQVCEKQASQKHYHDKHTQGREFVVGQRVMVKNFRPGPTYVAGTITSIVGPLTYTICVDSGQLWKRHIDHIKPLGYKLVQDEFTQVDSNTGFEFANFPTQVEQLKHLLLSYDIHKGIVTHQTDLIHNFETQELILVREECRVCTTSLI